MARYIGPKTKISRKFGEPIYGPDKSFEKKNYPPGQHGLNKKNQRNMVFSWPKNKKLNILMGYSSASFATLSKRQAESRELLVRCYFSLSKPASTMLFTGLA